MGFTVFSVAYIIIFIAAAGIEVFRGIQRGFLKTAFSLCAVIISIILSAISASLISGGIASLADSLFNISKGIGFSRDIVRPVLAMISGPFLFLLLL